MGASVIQLNEHKLCLGINYKQYHLKLQKNGMQIHN